MATASNIFNDITKTLSPDMVSVKNKDILVKSKNREDSKKKLEKFLKTKEIPFKSIFKKSKSSSLDVIFIPEINADVIFKPIIQKGAGGLGFEKELKVDLENYFNGEEIQNLKHKTVVAALQKELKITPTNDYSVTHEGALNKRREIQFNGNKVVISNSKGDTLTDITVQKSSGKKMFLSLKLGSTYYVVSASIYKYFLDKRTQVGINKYFGFDGSKMGGFGEEYVCKTPKPNYSKVSQDLAELLSQAVGTNVVLVHKKTDSDVLVKNVGSTNKVTVTGLSADSYVYPEPGVRKYANIKANAMINGANYKINFQFRGTTAADVGPKYLRILLERL
jgi:hypothetical protein